MGRLTRNGTAELSRETNFSGANGGREKMFFPIQLTTSKICSLTRLILALAISDDPIYISIEEKKKG